MSNSTSPHSTGSTHSRPPKRLQRKFTASFYFSGLLCGLVLLPIVLLSIFELSSRVQTIEFLRFELESIRERIVENTRTVSSLQNTANSAPIDQNETAKFENTLKKHLRLASELTITGAQCFQKTVPVLVQATYAAAANQAQIEIYRSRNSLQEEATARRKELITSLEQAKARATSEIDATQAETEFLDKNTPFLMDTEEELLRAFATSSLSEALKSERNAEEIISGVKATAIREPFARLSSNLGIIAEGHRSATLVKNLDRQIVRFLDASSQDGAYNLAAPLNVGASIILFERVSEALVDLSDRRKELELANAQRRREIEEINRQISTSPTLNTASPLSQTLPEELPDLTSCPGEQSFLKKWRQEEPHSPSEENGPPPSRRPATTTCSISDDLAHLLPVWSVLPVFCWLSPILTIPSALLYSVTVVLSGAIGSVFAAFYFRYPDIIARMFLGLVAGMVALLVLKGGKFLFVVDFGIATLENPYSGALAGILAGLFTERGFKLIEHLIDSGIDRLKSDNNGGNSETEVNLSVSTDTSYENGDIAKSSNPKPG